MTGERGMKVFQSLDAVAQGGGLLEDARAIIEAARTTAYRMVNAALVQRNWLLGKRIAEEELKGEGRAEYGRQVIGELAERLTAEYGAGFDFGSLYKFVRFYRQFEILDSLSPKSGGLLSWTHYRTLLQVENPEARRRGEGDNPTLGIVLCADTDSDVARYSVLKGSEQLFASKYKLMLPSEEELRAEIEAQKAVFEAQHGGKETHAEAQRGKGAEGGMDHTEARRHVGAAREGASRCEKGKVKRANRRERATQRSNGQTIKRSNEGGAA